MKTLRRAADVRAALAPLRASGAAIGFVPTMGAFHQGHLTLFRTARRECGVVVASLFVNPTQFGDPADLAAYPRGEARDAALAEEAGVDLMFAPSADEMYPAGFATWVDVGGAAVGLRGRRPAAIFGGWRPSAPGSSGSSSRTSRFSDKKDAQQVAVIERVVRDLELPLEIRVVPTVREPDGLAMSSRNVRLSADERQRARALPRALGGAVAGVDPVSAARSVLNGLEPEYVEVLDLGDVRCLAAAIRVGSVRLRSTTSSWKESLR